MKKYMIMWLLFHLAIMLSPTEAQSKEKPIDNKATESETIAKTVKQPEKRGTVRLTVIPGAVGQQNYPYRYVYTNPQPLQQTAQYSNQQYAYTSSQPQYNNYLKPVTTVSTPVKYEYVKQYTPQLILPTPYPAQYTTPTAMLLVLSQPNPNSPYTLMLIPQHGYPYIPNNLPYPTGQSYIPTPVYEPQHRFAYNYVVPQYVSPKTTPYNNYLSQNAGFAASQQLLYPGNNYSQTQPTYQEAEASKDSSGQTTQSPNYGNRVRPLEQYNKG